MAPSDLRHITRRLQVGTDVIELLGDDAEYLLNHKADAFPREHLILPLL